MKTRLVEKADYGSGTKNTSRCSLTKREHKIRMISAREIFSGLSADDIEAILAQGKRYRHLAGGYVYQLEEKQAGLYFLKEGAIEEFRLTSEGQKLPVSRITPGQFFGFASVQSAYCCFAQATEESTVWFISFLDMEKIFQNYPKLAVNLLRWLAFRLAEMEERVETTTYNYLKARVARQLLKLSRSQSSSLVNITQEELSLWALGSRPKVSIILQEFQDAGAVTLSRGKILIRNQALLEDWSD